MLKEKNKTINGNQIKKGVNEEEAFTRQMIKIFVNMLLCCKPMDSDSVSDKSQKCFNDKNIYSASSPKYCEKSAGNNGGNSTNLKQLKICCL